MQARSTQLCYFLFIAVVVIDKINLFTHIFFFYLSHPWLLCSCNYPEYAMHWQQTAFLR